MTHRCYRN